MRLDHSPQWRCINTNHSKPRNFVTPWKEPDGVGGWWFAWLTPWSSARAFLDISTAIVRKKERDWEEESVKILSAVRTEDLDWTVNTSWTVPGGPTVGINNTPQSTVHTLPIHGELFNKIWMFKFDFVTAFGQQRKCPMKRRMAHSCHNRWHLDWQFFGWKINETDCHFTSWKENSF